MRRALLCAALALAALGGATPAQAEFGLHSAEATTLNADGSPATQAGAHPYALRTVFSLNMVGGPGSLPDGSIRDFHLDLPPGVVANPTAVPRCEAAEFIIYDPSSTGSLCPPESAVGYIGFLTPGETKIVDFAAIYNLVPPPGVAARFGFHALGVSVVVQGGLRPGAERNLYASIPNATQAEPFEAADTILWGDPADPSHDAKRGNCATFGGSCSSNAPERAFLTMPSNCAGPLATRFAIDSWQGSHGALLSGGEPDLSDPAWSALTALSHDAAVPPAPVDQTGCGILPFTPSIAAQPTSKAASSPSGLDFSLAAPVEGLVNPAGIAQSTIRKAVVTLPEGMSANPSLAEGLEVCTMAELDAESATSVPGEGCPGASKIGTVEVETPLLEENVDGSLYVAKPYENYADNSLLALYLVLQNRTRGISVKQALRVDPDPVTGRLTTVAEELPQLPFSHFKLHFREGTRSPLTTPQACGSYDVKALLYPWSGAPPVTSTSAFQIVTGPGEGPCPSGGLPPFKPGLVAGTINNRAGSFSPFNLRLFRSDSEQEITHFSIKLPPGIVGKLAGVAYCSDAQIEAAKARTGPHGGQEELDNPSCPKASEIGRTLAGAGVGPSLTYAPGKVYLAGPYHGSNLSMVAITAGKVGPFDIGTVVIRQAFKIDPETAEVFIDSVGSDPIPHIVRGIPVHLRDIRAYVDRSEFVLNPTDCTATSTASTLLGSGLDFVSEADDNPITVTSRFQAADCAALSFKPQLSMKLTGGTKRGGFPKFTAHLAMNGIGESGIQSTQVTLPKSEFIANAHFNTICTRVQFKEGAGNGASCPAGSIYGHAKATTPILSEPLEGPVFLRSNGSERNLPDLVVALHNAQLDFDLVGFVDSVDGRLRNRFEAAPDAPVTSFDIELEGGSKGLFENSTNLCAKKHFAAVSFTGQNGKAYSAKPVLQVKCPKKHKRHAKRHHRRHAGR